VRPAILSALVLVALAGCGGGSSHQAQTTQREAASGDSGGGEQDQGGLDAIPVADRHAFVQIATAASDLNTGASVLLVHGAARPQDTLALRRLIPLVGALKPRDPGLRGLRAQVLGDLRRAIRIRSRNPSASGARAMLADAAGIRAALRRYSDGHPAIGGVTPD
jgi:hypothetical protein